MAGTSSAKRSSSGPSLRVRPIALLHPRDGACRAVRGGRQRDSALQAARGEAPRLRGDHAAREDQGGTDPAHHRRPAARADLRARARAGGPRRPVPRSLSGGGAARAAVSARRRQPARPQAIRGEPRSRPEGAVRLKIKGTAGPCHVFMPARYSKLIDAPSLLTGPMTVVGKVVRRLTEDRAPVLRRRHGRPLRAGADRILGGGAEDARPRPGDDAR